MQATSIHETYNIADKYSKHMCKFWMCALKTGYMCDTAGTVKEEWSLLGI